jgi:hypothetical protein
MFWLNRKKLLVEQEEMSSCRAGEHLAWSNEKRCPIAENDDKFPCRAGTHVAVFSRTTCLLAQKVHVPLSSKKRRCLSSNSTSSNFVHTSPNLSKILPSSQESPSPKRHSRLPSKSNLRGCGRNRLGHRQPAELSDPPISKLSGSPCRHPHVLCSGQVLRS